MHKSLYKVKQFFTKFSKIDKLKAITTLNNQLFIYVIIAKDIFT
jgi:hypothetical protein